MKLSGIAAAVVVQTAAALFSVAAAQAGTPGYSDAAALGKMIFFDPALSASGKMSCASCHDPAHAYGPPNGRAAQYGGANLRAQGGRAVPSLRYVLSRTPIWNHARPAIYAERITETDNAPSGGFGWDGRFDRLSQQASFPLLNPNEMANKDVAMVVSKLQRASYANQFRAARGGPRNSDSSISGCLASQSRLKGRI